MSYTREAAIEFVATRTGLPLELVARVFDRFTLDMAPEQIATTAAALVVEGLDAEIVADILFAHTAYRVSIGELDPSAEAGDAAAAEAWIAAIKQAKSAPSGTA